MGRRSSDAYDNALGLRESETIHADTFEAEFPVITGRTVEILSHGESPDPIARSMSCCPLPSSSRRPRSRSPLQRRLWRRPPQRHGHRIGRRAAPGGGFSPAAADGHSLIGLMIGTPAIAHAEMFWDHVNVLTIEVTHRHSK